MNIDEPSALSGEVSSGQRKNEVKILVVDDEDAIRTAMRIILSPVGYRIVTASNPEEALEVLSSAGDVQLVICDLVMPGMDLREFLKLLRALYPGVDVAYCSGFPKSRFERLGIRINDDHFIAKPFHPRELRTRISEILQP